MDANGEWQRLGQRSNANGRLIRRSSIERFKTPFETESPTACRKGTAKSRVYDELVHDEPKVHDVVAKLVLGKLVRELHPLPLVPDVIAPLCPEPAPLRRPTWEQFVSSFAPAVRELPLGERPGDWANGADGANDTEGAASAASSLPAPARVEALRAEAPPATGPQQYQVQFSATEEHVQLIERAKSLLAREADGKSLGDLHLQAMRLLVAALEKQKFAVTERPRKVTGTDSAAESKSQSAVHAPTTKPRPRSRRIPADVRRAVFERDGGRCSYVDERGERCRETCGLELHHRQPFGKAGSHTAANLTLHCPAHNALAAELDFGRRHMAARRNPHRHESLASEERSRERGSPPQA